MGKGSKTVKMLQKERRRKRMARERRQIETAKQEAKQRKMG